MKSSADAIRVLSVDAPDARLSPAHTLSTPKRRLLQLGMWTTDLWAVGMSSLTLVKIV